MNRVGFCWGVRVWVCCKNPFRHKHTCIHPEQGIVGLTVAAGKHIVDIFTPTNQSACKDGHLSSRMFYIRWSEKPPPPASV